MQILGLSNSTPRTESRWKALLWPTIRNDGDFDYITEQGFWICLIVAVITFVYSVFAHLPGGIFDAAFYFLAALGVRQRSTVAGIAAFVAYLLGTLVLERYTHGGFSIIRVIFLALLLANVRGIWLSSRWRKAFPMEPPDVPARLNQTFFDKLSDQMPARVWPKIFWLFYIFAVLEIGALLILLVAPRRV